MVSQSVVPPDEVGGVSQQEEEELPQPSSPPLRVPVSLFFAKPRSVLLTDFRGGDGDVVPHVGLAVQSFGQRDLPIVHVDVELPLQVGVPVDEVPAEEAAPLEQPEPELSLC